MNLKNAYCIAYNAIINLFHNCNVNVKLLVIVLIVQNKKNYTYYNGNHSINTVEYIYYTYTWYNIRKGACRH